MERKIRLLLFCPALILSVPACDLSREHRINTNGPFKHAMELDVKTLLNYVPDRLFAKFYIETGLKPKAEYYKGWENEMLAGHSLGIT